MAYGEDQRLGQYDLVRRLAVGGMADIFLATARGRGGLGGLPLVIKRVHHSHTHDRDFVDALVNEAQIAVQLTHPNIVRFLDLGKSDGNYFLAMEYVAGVNLAALLARVRDAKRYLPFEVTAFIVREICLALHYAHSCRDQNGQPLNIVHRDVSPHNILLGYSGSVKLADFGIAKANISRTQTAANIVKGKFDYMSPEHAWGERIDARADVFSLGVVLYQMLCGRLPFEDEEGSTDLIRRLHNLHHKTVSTTRDARPDVPVFLESIVVRALHREREQRFQTAREMAQQLNGYLEASAPEFTTESLARYLREIYPDQGRPGLDGPDDETRTYEAEQLEKLAHAARDDSSLIVVGDSALATVVDDSIQYVPTLLASTGGGTPTPEMISRPKWIASNTGMTSEFDVVTTIYVPDRHVLPAPTPGSASPPTPLPMVPARAEPPPVPTVRRGPLARTMPPLPPAMPPETLADATPPPQMRSVSLARERQMSMVTRLQLVLGAALVVLVVSVIVRLLL